MLLASRIMFAPGEKQVKRNGATGHHFRRAEDRNSLSFIRSAFCDRLAEKALRKALPDAEDAPPMLLPPGWEQRCDEKSRRIFFVDHITCSTTWEDPRLRKKEEEEAGADVPSKRSDDADRDDHFDGAAADLADGVLQHPKVR